MKYLRTQDLNFQSKNSDENLKKKVKKSIKNFLLFFINFLSVLAMQISMKTYSLDYFAFMYKMLPLLLLSISRNWPILLLSVSKLKSKISKFDKNKYSIVVTWRPKASRVKFCTEVYIWTIKTTTFNQKIIHKNFRNKNIWTNISLIAHFVISWE